MNNNFYISHDREAGKKGMNTNEETSVNLYSLTSFTTQLDT